MATKTRLFLSHAHEDDHVAFDLRQKLRASDYPFAVSIVLAGEAKMRRTPEQLKHGFLAPRIRWSHAMLLLLSEDALLSDWVRWELQYATEQRKLVVAVRAPAFQKDVLPKTLYGAPTVDRDPEQIWSAIENLRASDAKVPRHQRSRISASSSRRPV